MARRRRAVTGVDYWDEVYATRTDVPVADARAVELGTTLARGARVLDVGCGAGATALALAEQGHRVDALDYSAEALRLCDDAARRSGVARRVRTIRADLTTYAYPRARYDLITSVRALQNVVRSGVAPLVATLARLKAATRRGGRNYFVISTDVRELPFPDNATSEADVREMWLRDYGTATQVGVLDKAAAARAIMGAYASRDWEVEALDVPRSFHLFRFGTGAARCAYWIELIARRI